ncbi:DNA-binding protein [Pseudomonas japonica]|uniref:DNA-binding protein n=1 Tax=Pseudomonas japonica TaxID=256466 RepID=UPI0015E3AA44|nr:DNA-binding protein [Pseudomonas japonica]MBA1289159.1 DNA-binding protein [Pseudomonas japonica]
MPNPYPSHQARSAARSRLTRVGMSVKEWAERNDFTPSLVYAVLNGQKKCLRGQSHRAAVLLGIKDGELPD